jgi:hypothetical protein
MEADKDKAATPEKIISPDEPVKEDLNGKSEAPPQSKPKNGASDTDGQSNNERDTKEDSYQSPHDTGQAERIFSRNMGDIVGGNVSVHNIIRNNYFVSNSPHDESSSFDSFLGKLDDNDPFGQVYRDISRSTARDTHLRNKDIAGREVKANPFETREEIETWYCEELSEWEICFVQAAAVLHGAPFHQIRDAAETLYHPVITHKDGIAIAAPAQKISEKILRTHLHMEIITTEGAERLLWFDANASGLSTFAVQLLPIIVRQANLTVAHHQRLPFLKQLEEWSRTLSGECAWRATRALGAVWIKLDENHFLYMVREWATSDIPSDWRRAAILLDGAYEVEYAEQGENIHKSNNSIVLNLLKKWTKHAHNSFQVNVGTTVGQAYQYIGQRSLIIALDGLDELLHYPLHRKHDLEIQVPLVVYVSATWGYITLARFGYAREVLKHIASLTEKYCYQRNSPKGKERLEYRARCRFMLETIFHIFFLIASASLNGVHEKERGGYKRETQLPQHPVLPGEEGQDVLLAGILSSEEAEWYQHIMTILCGAILEKNAESAFYLLKIWAEAIFKEQEPERHLLRQAFLEFLLALAAKGDQWCMRLVKMEEYDYPDLFVMQYKECLEQWRIKKINDSSPALGALAKDVLGRLRP